MTQCIECKTNYRGYPDFGYCSKCRDKKIKEYNDLLELLHSFYENNYNFLSDQEQDAFLEVSSTVHKFRVRL